MLTAGVIEVNGVKYDVILKEQGLQALTGGKKNESSNAKESQEGGKSKGKKAKGTRKLSGYMKFCQTARKELLQEQPGLRIPDIGRALGAKWRALSDAEKAKY